MSAHGFVYKRTVPILRILDAAKAREFYLHYLGCKVDYEHRFDESSPLFMQVSLGELVIRLSEHYGDAIPGAAVQFDVTGIRELHEFLSAKNHPYQRPGLQNTPWGGLALNLTDPFGNRLNFVEKLEP